MSNHRDELPADLWMEGAPWDPFEEIAAQLKSISDEEMEHYWAHPGSTLLALWRREAKLLADVSYRTNRPSAPFGLSKHLYSTLYPRQLRTYLNWRTQHLTGGWVLVDEQYVELYAMELALQIRGESIEEAAKQLLSLWSWALEHFADWQLTHLRGLTQAFFVELDSAQCAAAAHAHPELFASFPQEQKWQALLLPQESNDEAINALLEEAAGELPEAEKSAARTTLIAQAWRELAADVRPTFVPGQSALVWGAYRSQRWDPLHVFPFTSFSAPKECLVRARPDLSFRCRNGVWQALVFTPDVKKLAQTALALFRAVDDSKARVSPKIRQAVTRAQKKLAAQARAQIDTGKLAGIRAQATDIQEKLLVPEEENLLPQKPKPAAVKKTPPPAPVPPTPAGPFTAQQLQFLKALWEKAPAKQLQGICSEPLSLTVEALNNQFLELIGDAAIEMQNDQAGIVSDYREDVEKILADNGLLPAGK